MLLSKHCPHTGIVNFYDAREPHFSIGSIARCGTVDTDHASMSGYTWRFYAPDGTKCGRSCDVATAEISLRALMRSPIQRSLS